MEGTRARVLLERQLLSQEAKEGAGVEHEAVSLGLDRLKIPAPVEKDEDEILFGESTWIVVFSRFAERFYPGITSFDSLVPRGFPTSRNSSCLAESSLRFMDEPEWIDDMEEKWFDLGFTWNTFAKWRRGS